jgi:hypothetical protein
MITLNTIIYEGNYNDFLKENNWFFTFNSKYISKKIITVNNLSSKDIFENKIKHLKEYFDFEVIYVDDLLEEVKTYFNLTIDSSNTGYYYTIPYFVSLYKTDSEYFFNVASDCMDDIKITDDFFEKSFIELTENNFCNTTMVTWCKNNEITTDVFSPHFGITIGEYEESESFKKLNRDIPKSENFSIRYNFTDQLFLGKTNTLKQINYNVDENISGMWYTGPQYGGNCFEKRMVGHHIINNVYNLVFKNSDYYIHDINKK